MAASHLQEPASVRDSLLLACTALCGANFRAAIGARAAGATSGGPGSGADKGGALPELPHSPSRLNTAAQKEEQLRMSGLFAPAVRVSTASSPTAGNGSSKFMGGGSPGAASMPPSPTGKATTARTELVDDGVGGEADGTTADALATTVTSVVTTRTASPVPGQQEGVKVRPHTILL